MNWRIQSTELNSSSGISPLWPNKPGLGAKRGQVLGNPLKQRQQPHPKELSQLKGKGVFFPLRAHDKFYNTIS